jgi:hypothetical protein
MDWVKLATRYYGDERIEALDDAAEVMFTRGLARAGELEREGFIPDSSLPKLTRRRRYETVVEQLVVSGLWSRVDGGYRVSRWADWQDALDDLARRRTADRERQRRRRERMSASRDTAVSSRDVTRTEEEEDKELRGVGSAKSHDRARASPAPKCPKHANDPNPPPCGPCADARRSADQWRADQDRRVADAPRCTDHPSQIASHCASCRSERIARKDFP